MALCLYHSEHTICPASSCHRQQLMGQGMWCTLAILPICAGTNHNSFRLSCMLVYELHGGAGIDDPYEAPERPEITLDVDDPQGRRQSPEAMARIILAYLEVRYAELHLSALCHAPISQSTALVTPDPRTHINGRCSRPMYPAILFVLLAFLFAYPCRALHTFHAPHTDKPGAGESHARAGHQSLAVQRARAVLTRTVLYADLLCFNERPEGGGTL